jgi:hypothetical protein
MILDNAISRNILARQLELRLKQSNDLSSRTRTRRNGTKHVTKSYERHIDNHKISFWMQQRQLPHVSLLTNLNPVISPQSRIQLVASHVDGNHACSPST